MSVDKNTVPAITSVKDDQGTEIDNGGTTAATSVQLSGLAGALESVDILDGADWLGGINTNAAGHWIVDTRMTLGAHSITAKGKAGTSPASTFTVVEAK